LRELKNDAAIVVLLACGLEIEIGESDSARVAGCQIKEGRADDGVVSEFELAAVLKDEESRLLGRFGIGCGVIILICSGILSGVGLRDIFDRRNVGSGTRSATVEDGGTSLVVGVAVVRACARAGVVVIIVIVVVVSCAEVDGVWDRDGVHRGRRNEFPMVVMMMAIASMRRVWCQERDAEVGSEAVGAE